MHYFRIQDIDSLDYVTYSAVKDWFYVLGDDAYIS